MENVLAFLEIIDNLRNDHFVFNH